MPNWSSPRQAREDGDSETLSWSGDLVDGLFDPAPTFGPRRHGIYGLMASDFYKLLRHGND